MSDGSNIGWLDRPGTKPASWNPIRARNKATGGVGHFCVKVSGGCANCYAEAMQKRMFGNPIRYAMQDRDKVEIFLDEKILLQPLHWKKPRTVFVCSMTDLFGEWVSDAWLDRIFAIAALCPQHTFILLSKRSKRMREYLSRPGLSERWWEAGDDLACRIDLSVGPSEPFLNAGKGKTPIPLPNVWLGVSVEDQPTADKRIPHLLATPAVVRFVSYEPALGPVDFATWCHIGGINQDHAIHYIDMLDQIICGAESGRNRRPFDLAWARSVRDQCKAAGAAFFMKQGSALRPGSLDGVPEDLRVREFPEGSDKGASHDT